MQELTEEQKQDIQERITKFMEGYEALVKELQVDFFSGPVFVPTGNNIWSVSLQNTPKDLKYLPIPSPLQNESHV